MRNRLDQEREKELQPKRIDYAIEQLKKYDCAIAIVSKTHIEFFYGKNLIKFYPYSGWFSGKGIKDGRGIKNLLKQLK